MLLGFAQLFIIYLSTPSIVSIIDNTNDVTLDIGTIDEDQNDNLKINLKSLPFLCFFVEDTKSCGEIYFKTILKHSFLYDSIFIPI